MNRKMKKDKEKTTNNKNIIKKEKKQKIQKKDINQNNDMQNKNFKLLQGVDESTILYNIRKSFVELLKPNSKKEFELYVMYSHVFNNMYFLKILNKYHYSYILISIYLIIIYYLIVQYYLNYLNY